MTNQTTPLLSELLQPQTIDELPLPGSDIRTLQQMVSQGRSMNILFQGGTGTGKTTACKIILKRAVGKYGVEFRGSAVWTMDTVAQIDGYASSSGALVGGRKACLIDEVDLLPGRMQTALRSVVDKVAKCTTLLFTANDMQKVIPAIRSRTLPICFDRAPSDYREAKQHLRTRYMRILAEANITYDPVRLERVIEDHFPDLRTITNRLQWEFGTAATA